MTDLYKFCQNLFIFFRKNNIKVVLLRPQYIESDFISDLDILIEHQNLIQISIFINQQELLITFIDKRTDGITYFIYDSKIGKSFHIDFIYEVSLKGVIYLDKNKIFNTSFIKNNISYVQIDYQFIILVINHFIKNKKTFVSKNIQDLYSSLKAQTDNSLNVLIADYVGIDTASYILDMLQNNRISNNDIKTNSVIMYYFKIYGLSIIYNILLYHLKEIFLRLRYKKKIIAFYGIDGAGKTTIINNLKSHLKDFSRLQIYNHFLPRLLNSSGYNPDIISSNPHSEPPRKIILSIIKLFYYCLRYWISYYLPRRGSAIHIYDRYLFDIFIDPIRFRYKGNFKLTAFLCNLAPKPFIAILVNIDPRIALNRKQEISIEEANRQSSAYKKFMRQTNNPYIINGDEEIQYNIHLLLGHFSNCLAADVKKFF